MDLVSVALGRPLGRFSWAFQSVEGEMPSEIEIRDGVRRGSTAVHILSCAGIRYSSRRTWSTAPLSQGVENTPSNAAKAKLVSEAVMTSADPQAAVAALSPTDQKLFKAYNTVVEVKPGPTTYSPADSKARRTQLTAGTGEVTLMAAGCWNTSAYYVGTNAFGGWLWKSTVSGGFCTNGSLRDGGTAISSIPRPFYRMVRLG